MSGYNAEKEEQEDMSSENTELGSCIFQDLWSTTCTNRLVGNASAHVSKKEKRNFVDEVGE